MRRGILSGCSADLQVGKWAELKQGRVANRLCASSKVKRFTPPGPSHNFPGFLSAGFTDG